MKTIDFHRRFTPLTAMPFSQDRTYYEVPPVPALLPFVRCFWGSAEEFAISAAPLYTGRLVIPDTCVDFIVQTEGEAASYTFCGLDQEAYYSDLAGSLGTIFGVRLYFWAVPYLIREEARCMALPASPCEAYFPGLEPYLDRHHFPSLDFAGKKAVMERYLLGCISHGEVPAALLDCLDLLLGHQGNISVKEMSENIVLSPRTVERLFRRHLGLPPKKLADLVRYQNLWRHVLSNRDIHIQDEVYELGFYDQAHLLNTFRKYHGMGIGEALEYSRPGRIG